MGDSVTLEGYFSDVNMYQGNCDLNLTNTNLTERTYMNFMTLWKIQKYRSSLENLFYTLLMNNSEPLKFKSKV